MSRLDDRSTAREGAKMLPMPSRSHGSRRRVPRAGWALSLAIGFALLLEGSVARADATSWLYVGGGAGVFEQNDREQHAVLQLDTGLGSSARHPLVVGGIFRAQGYFGAGLDAGMAARVVTRGFAIGGYGVGVDAGFYRRFWGQESFGFTGSLVLGAPWGITFVGGTSVGHQDPRVYFVSLGIDLARLTVHRQTGLEWFENPSRSPSE
jgi:hypothetical protein